MNKQIIIVRHAKSDWSLPLKEDYDRPLSGRGIVDCTKMGQWLSAQDCTVDCVLSSSALRAWQTTEAIAHSLGVGRNQIRYDKRLYHADVGVMMRMLKEQSENTRTLVLVGHNPGLDNLLTKLIAKKVKKNKNEKMLTTGAVAILSIAKAWKDLAAQSGDLSVLMRPREL